MVSRNLVGLVPPRTQSIFHPAEYPLSLCYHNPRNSRRRAPLSSNHQRRPIPADHPCPRNPINGPTRAKMTTRVSKQSSKEDVRHPPPLILAHTVGRVQEGRSESVALHSPNPKSHRFCGSHPFHPSPNTSALDTANRCWQSETRQEISRPPTLVACRLESRHVPIPTVLISVGRRGIWRWTLTGTGFRYRRCHQ